MEKKEAERLVEQTFNAKFSHENYVRFMRNLLNEYDESKARDWSNNTYVYEPFREHISRFRRLGVYTDPDGIEAELLVVETRNTAKLERARTSLRNFVIRRLTEKRRDHALVAFYSREDEGADWRFSYIKIEHESYRNEKGKVRTRRDPSPAKRYSFLVGEHENAHTAKTQLLPILQNDHSNPGFGEIENAFSIEKVTDEFFEQYRDLFLKISESKKIPGALAKAGLDPVRFTKKLLGQIVFLYFLQKKGWLGVPVKEAWGKGEKKFLQTLYTQAEANNENFFSDYLQYLFYEALASDRTQAAIPDHYKRFGCKIPFLNGGLFEAEYDWKKAGIVIPNDLFRNKEKTKAGDTGTGILDVFDRYNFTIKEDEPLEKEVAVDPEMLGKVFENMLEIRERKSKGAFYTPREIVHYMCQESLIHYLDNAVNDYGAAYQEVGREQVALFGSEGKKGQQALTIEHRDIRVPKEEIEIFIRKGFLVIENEELAAAKGEDGNGKFRLPDSIREHAKLLDKKLAEVKVCDPAIGSGAFPVGLLHEIVNARLVLNTYLKNKKHTAYCLKRHAIQESIYGVDIDESAIDIARLRLWLSLIVDEDDFDEIEALPNLDYKIVRGNSLVGLPDGYEPRWLSEIEEKKRILFDCTDEKKKRKLKADIETAIKNYLKNTKNSIGYDVEFDFNLFFSEVTHSKKGFDVVIANPPYLKERDNANVFEPVNKSTLGKRYHQGKMDYWFYFLHLAIDKTNPKGVISFITSRYWLNSSGAKKLINRIKDNLAIRTIIDIGKLKVFQNVVGHHMVGVYSKTRTGDVLYKKLESSINDIDKNYETPNVKILPFKQHEVYSVSGDITFNKGFISVDNVMGLGELYEASIGVQESIDKISNKQAEASSRRDIKPGQGVFVLSKEELAGLKLNEEEAQVIKRYLDPSDVSRFYITPTSNKYLIYSDKVVKNKIATNSSFKNLRKHLDNYSEFITSSNKPYGLHRPREKKFFESSKIIFKGMFKTPEFALDDTGYYFGFSFSSIISKSNYSLKYLLGILNSEFAMYWYYSNGKQRGIGIDMGVEKLRVMPIPLAERQQVGMVESLVTIISQYLKLLENRNIDVLLNSYYQDVLNGIVYELYFPRQVAEADKHIIKHIGRLPLLEDSMSPEQKLAIIKTEFERLYDPNHPVRNNLETLDSIEEVRIIKEAVR